MAVGGQWEGAIRAPTLASVIARRLEDEIVARGWPVGEVLGSESELLEYFGVSRAVFREAVRVVENTGAARMRRGPGGGLIVSADGFMFINRALIISSAARNKVATVYQFSVYVREGGLLSYGPNFGDIYRRAATYVDRILRGTKPADLPVQLPVKFEMVLNAKTAKALGLTVPQSIVLRADDVIE